MAMCAYTAELHRVAEERAKNERKAEKDVAVVADVGGGEIKNGKRFEAFSNAK